MGKSGAAGFTLLEVGLAISIGLLASASMLAVYLHVKDDAGDAIMRQRINSLKSIVETLYSAQGSCPPISDVRSYWKAKRPNDYLTSPWGGAIYDPLNENGIGGGDFKPSQNPQGLKYGTEGNMTSGALYYYRLVDSNGDPSALLTSSMWDQTLHAMVPITAYGLAGLKSDIKYYMVTSGR